MYSDGPNVGDFSDDMTHTHGAVIITVQANYLDIFL
jgi:hypothetical protein